MYIVILLFLAFETRIIQKGLQSVVNRRLLWSGEIKRFDQQGLERVKTHPFFADFDEWAYVEGTSARLSSKEIIRDFLKACILIRNIPLSNLQGHLILNFHRLGISEEIKDEIAKVRQAQVALAAKKGDAMYVDARGKGKDKGDKPTCKTCVEQHFGKCWKTTGGGAGGNK